MQNEMGRGVCSQVLYREVKIQDSSGHKHKKLSKENHVDYGHELCSTLLMYLQPLKLIITLISSMDHICTRCVTY